MEQGSWRMARVDDAPAMKNQLWLRLLQNERNCWTQSFAENFSHQRYEENR